MSRRQFNCFSYRERVTCPSGNRIRETFELKIEPDGNRHLVKTGEEDLYEIIQSFEAECNIANIVRRFNNGDVNALNRAQGMYIDSVGLPTNLHEANQLLNKVGDVYYKLPENERKVYPTFSAFLEQFSTLDKVNSYFSSKMPSKAKNKPSTANKNEEVKTDVSK